MAKPMTSTAMQAMKAMRAMKTKHGALSAIGVYSTVAERVGIQPKQVEEIAEAMMALAATQLNATGSFKLAGALNMKLKKKPARQATEGVHPITKEPCIFKARNASQTLRTTAMKHFVLMVMFADYLVV